MSRIDFLRERVAAAALNAAALQDLGHVLAAEFGMPVNFRVAGHNSKIVLRMDPGYGGLQVNVPPGMPSSYVEDVVRRHEGWVRVRKGKMPEKIPFLPGGNIPLLGLCRTIHQDTARAFPAKLTEICSNPAILVGRTDFIEARVTELVKSEAKRHFEDLTRKKALLLGKKVSRVSVKDTSSRWGSCNSSGEIFYNWRLALAPLEISEYVVAHETAHLCEMNHGTRFWKLCAEMSPISPQRARSWLEMNGDALKCFGPERG